MMKPWETEPNREEFVSDDGLACLILRNSTGHLCGYVAVPSGHPMYGKDYDQVPIDNVHGGLTFAGPSDKYRPGKGLWWFGFDCAHCGDLIPGASPVGIYRDINYVFAEIKKLAYELFRMKP